MSKITTKEVEHVAQLARLHFSPEKIEQFTRQINSILEYMGKLNELDTKGIEPTSHAVPLPTAWREDRVNPSLDPEKILSGAPERADFFVVVPKVIE